MPKTARVGMKRKARKPVKKSPKRSRLLAEPALKLRIELVPKPLYEINLRSSDVGLGKYRWDILRSEILETNGPKCAICGDTERPHGHEIWEYQVSKKRGIARLVKVEIICRRCHDIHHWGNTLRLIFAGSITPEGERGLREHFQRVNGCTEQDFDRHVERAFEEHKERSKKKWTVDWGDFEDRVLDAMESREQRRQQKERKPFSFR